MLWSLFCLSQKNKVQVVECQVSLVWRNRDFQIPLKQQTSDLAAYCDHLGSFPTSLGLGSTYRDTRWIGLGCSLGYGMLFNHSGEPCPEVSNQRLWFTLSTCEAVALLATFHHLQAVRDVIKEYYNFKLKPMKSESPVLVHNLPNYPVKGGLFFTRDQWGNKLWAIKQQPRITNMEVAENGFERNLSNPKCASFMPSLHFESANHYKCGCIIWYQEQ